jgi:hypothetical protein
VNLVLLDPESCISLIRTLALGAFLFQAIEELVLESATKQQLLPREEEVRKFFGGFLPLHLRMNAAIRVCLILWLLMDPSRSYAFVLLFLATWLRSIRFLGSLNGGSDAMTQVVLLPLVLTSCSGGNASVIKGALFWIGIQSVLSYFLSGLRKAKNPAWWNGDALTAFLLSSRVSIFALEGIGLRANILSRAMSLGVLAFELLFPLALLSPKLCSLFLMFGGIFHFGVFLGFGLNRFLWVWLASYPAIYFIASTLGS